jgi:tRNA threonylcarbamoyladenosine biosynthesis protein TsaE
VATASGVDAEAVLSPTFVLCHEYHGTARTIYHFDVYRIADDDEFLALGPDEYFESEGVTFVEWGERVEACLPPNRWDVHIEWSDDQRRQIEITATSPELERVLDQLHEELSRTSEGDDHLASN